MAEHEKPKQTVIINGSDFTIENSHQQTILDTNEANVAEDIDDEILQQAFGGVSQSFEQNGGYKDENGENVTLIADGSVLTDVSGNVVGTINDDGSTYTLSSPLNISEATRTGTNKITEGNALKDAGTSSKVIESAGSATGGLTKTQEVVQGDVSSKVLQLPTTSTLSANQPLFVIRSAANLANTETENSSNSVLSSLIKCTPTTLATLSSQIAPLGSSQNPIRIIQQGNQYTSTQQLNPEQLSQIMQVVQQQQAVRQAKQVGGTSVIYNPETQTKIVYRVINPADLHTKASDVSTSLKTVQVGASGRTYTGKKRGRKRKIDLKKPDDDTDAPELSRKEKEDKKKNRPKTRSGRVSKPPRHMIKDYKQIHLVDWNEDYDDSDGGYSDYKASGDDDENGKRQRAEEDDYEKLRPKRFACGGCDRRYIGSGGLERHWTNFPDHKTFSKIAEGVAGAGKNDQDEIPTDAEASNDSSTHSFKDLNTKNLETEDSKTETKDNESAITGTPSVTEVKLDSTEPKEEVIKGQSDGRQTPVQNTAGKSRPWGRNSRRFKLMDLLERCSDEVVLDVALPRLARNCSVWHFLLSKAEFEKEAEEECQREAEEEDEDEIQVRLNFRDVYQQYEQLRLKVKQLYTECKVTQDNEADTLENSSDLGMLNISGDIAKSKEILNQRSSETKGEEDSDTILFEFSNPESARSLGEQCSVCTLTSEIPEHYSDMPASVSSSSRLKTTQEKYVSPGPGSMRKSKPKLYPGAVSVIPPLETDKQPRILGDTKPLEESEIRAQMFVKRPPANRLKLWVKDKDDEAEEEDFPFFGIKKESNVTSINENATLNSAILSKESHHNDVDMVGAAVDSVQVSHSASKLQRIDTSKVESSLTLPESTCKTKTTDIKCTVDTPTIQTVGNVTAIIHSEPILSVGSTARIASDELNKSKTENTQNLVKGNLPADVSLKIKNGCKDMDSSKTVECKIPDFKSMEFSESKQSSSLIVNSHVTSQVSSSAESKPNIFISQDGTKRVGTNLGSRQSMIPGNLQSVIKSQEASVSKPVVIMTQGARSSEAAEVTKAQDVISCISQSIHTTTHDTSGDTKYKILFQSSPHTVKKETEDETTDTMGNNMMDEDHGVVLENMRDSNHSSSVLALNTEYHAITTDIGAFISGSQPATDQDSKLEATSVRLLPELTEDTGALPVSSSDATLLQPSGTSSTVTYQVIDEELAREETVTPVVGQDNNTGAPVVENAQVLEDVQVLQTGDGIILVKNPDGSFQLHNPHNQPIPIETVQALINLTPS